MSNIKALDKLVEFVSEDALLVEMVEAVEREVSERYIPLPVDMDGVPIHEGDVIQFVNEQGGTGAKVEVCAISKHYAYYGEGKHFYKASMCRHVKPRTVEDVLQCAGVSVAAIEDVAAEIRELMGVSE